jgi:hypothetical protein
LCFRDEAIQLVRVAVFKAVQIGFRADAAPVRGSFPLHSTPLISVGTLPDSHSHHSYVVIFELCQIRAHTTPRGNIRNERAIR